jgi:integrase
MRLPLLLAAWTGQRQGDLLRLPWTAYNGTKIRFRQSKTGARVEIPVVGPLKTALDAAARNKQDSVLVLNNSDGKPWTENGFRSSWGKARDRAGLAGLTFHDLRGTSATRLAGCSDAEIGTFTGLALADVRAILDKHYLNRDPRLAESAAAKLEKLAEAGTNSPKRAPK